MPSSSRRHSRPQEVEQDDNGEGSSRGPTPSSTTPDDSKRRRRNYSKVSKNNTQEHSAPRNQGGDSSGMNERQLNGNALLRVNGDDHGHGNTGDVGSSNNGYRPGAILRVKLRNFVTYSAVEFFPGPNLNMVIGPNGSGKSSLVCAICLGLGWSSQHLGRARDVSEFVKMGCREAMIEIELKHDYHSRNNPVITRIIKKGDNKSYYSLNGTAVPGKHVQTLARSMNIQIDNLCQFLPQDKVVEFAAMTPVELLQSTQRAAAGSEMLEQHENLKRLRTHHKELLNSSKGDRDVLKNLESRQEMQRDDVERLRARDATKKKIAWMEKCRPIPKYAAAKDRVKVAKERKNVLAAELKDLKAKLAPSLRTVNEKQEYESKLRMALQESREITNEGDEAADALARKVDDLEQKIKEADDMVEAEKKSVQTKKEDQKRIRGVIARIQKQMEDEPEPFNAKAANDKMAQCNTRRRQIADTVEDLNRQLTDMKSRGQAKVAEKSSSDTRLADLDTQAGQQELRLQKISPDSYKAWKWIQANQSQFEHKVYGPPVVECGLRDSRYANVVESLFQANDFKAFTAQCTNDFYKLQRLLTREMELTDVSFRVVSSSALDQYHAPLSREELKECGMEGWALDYLKGPDVVVSMLCGERALHATAVTLKDISQDQFTFLQNSNVRSWVVNGTVFQAVRRREYGEAGNSTRTKAVRDARIWTDRPVDSAAKERMQDQNRELDREIDAIKEELQALAESKRQLSAEHRTLGEELEMLRADKEDKQRAMTIFRGLPTKLAQEEEKLAGVDRHMGGVRERMEKILENRDKILVDKANVALDHAAAVVNCCETADALLDLEVQHLEAKSDFDTLKSRNEHINAMLEAKQAEEKAASEEATEGSARARELVTLVKELAAEAKSLAQRGDAAWDEYLLDFGRKSAEELEAEIESEKARLDLTHGGYGSTNVIQEFEDRQRRIDRLREGLEKFHEQQAEVMAAIEEIRSDWEPKLDALVERISNAFADSFARIGCAGQVAVYKASSSFDQDDERGFSTGGTYGVSGRDTGGDPTHSWSSAAMARQDEPANAGNRTNETLDFAHWALHILVKFRSNEPLSLLDSHRQSGGERAVSTIFYLMALQSLSQAPFRVVDEINQGMDPRNERMVHGRMVDVACGAGSQAGDGSQGPNAEDDAGGQYFLITPKLLSGLKYRRGMRVLNIVSGAMVPAPPSSGSAATDATVAPTDVVAGTSSSSSSATPHTIDFELWVRRAREINLALTKQKVRLSRGHGDIGSVLVG